MPFLVAYQYQSSSKIEMSSSAQIFLIFLFVKLNLAQMTQFIYIYMIEIEHFTTLFFWEKQYLSFIVISLPFVLFYLKSQIGALLSKVFGRFSNSSVVLCVAGIQKLVSRFFEDQHADLKQRKAYL